VIDSKTALAQTVAGAQALADNVNALQAQVDSLSAANIGLQAQIDAAQQTIAGLNATIAQQSAQIASLLAQNDPWAAVDKTGATDVTDKVQALWDKGLPQPAGKYLIDAVKGLKARNAVKLDPQAILVVKPNGASHYLAVEVMEGCSFDGGQIIGDRDQHDYSSGGTHEWGHGLKLRSGSKGSNVQICNCTGDGWQAVGDNVEARNITSTNNRRQGHSLFGGKGFRAYDCISSDTNGAPNGPCAGFDFEPDPSNPTITDAVLTRCKAINNRPGFLGWERSEVAGTVDVTLVDCVTENNANGVVGGAIAGKTSIKVQGGTHTNRASNIRAETGSTIAVDGCTFAFTGKDRTDFTLTGTDSRTKYDIQTPLSSTTGLKGTAKVGANTYK